MRTTRFEELRVWQESMNLALKVFKEFKTSKEFWIRVQIQRSCLSIPSNIAEGHDRRTTKEYMQFLTIARGSCAEVRTQLLLAQNAEIICEEASFELLESSNKITAMLNKQLSYLKSITWTFTYTGKLGEQILVRHLSVAYIWKSGNLVIGKSVLLGPLVLLSLPKSSRPSLNDVWKSGNRYYSVQRSNGPMVQTNSIRSINQLIRQWFICFGT